MMDNILMNQKVGKWNEACRFLKSKQSKLSSEEWTAIEFLADFWRDGNFDADSIADCESLIELLISSDKLHTNDRDIIVWSKEFRGIAKMMYTKDEDTFKQFKEAMRKFVGAHTHNPRVSNLTSQESFQVNDGLLRQHAQKWVKAYLFLANNSSNLSSEELEALDYLCKIWANDTLTIAQIKSCEILISYMAECDRLHGNNKEIIVQSKELRNITKLYISNGNDVYQKFQRLLLSIFREIQEQEESRSQNERQIHNEQREVRREQNAQNRVTPDVNTSRRAGTSKKKSKWWLWLLLLGILWAGYEFWFKDYMRDKDAPRTYVYATNLFLRSSKDAESEYNRVGKVPYGAELITYSNANGWAEVKFDGETGYVSSDYLLGYNDFQLLDGVWGNEDAKEVVMTAKCRMAILDFLKKYGLKTGTGAWQIYTKPKEMKPNSVLYPSLNDGYDEFTEFAFILTDNQTGKRRLGLYAFEEDEKPVIRYIEDAPDKGDIKSISYSKWNNKYRVVYSGQNDVYAHNKEVERNIGVQSQNKNVEITKLEFANVDYDNKVIASYGAQLYQDTKYLKAKVDFKRNTEASENVMFQIKILRPDGALIRGASSPTGYTFEQKVSLTGRNGRFFTLAWGNNEGTVYMPGTYTYEIWHNGKRAFVKTFVIENKTWTVGEKKAAESAVDNDETVYEAAEQMPEFPGGMTALMKFLQKKIKYPSVAEENGVQGRVVVSFIIEKDGSVLKADVLKGVDPYLDKEALRVVLSMPKWKPAKQAGKNVRCKLTVPVNFKLNQ